MAGSLHRTAYRQSRMPALLPDTATVLRPGEPVPDGGGGWTVVEDEVATVACSLQAREASVGREVQEAGRVVAATVWVAYLPHGTDCGPADKLAVTNAAGVSRGTYEVVETDAARSNAVVMAVNLRRVE